MSDEPFRLRMLSSAGIRALRLLGSTWSVTHEGRERERRAAQENSIIYAFLHGRIVVGCYVYRDCDAGIMISRHRDGSLIARVASSFGYKTFRGSTSDGARAAILQMSRLPPETPISLTTDGPRGPAGHVHPGIVHFAQHSGRLIVPLGFAARPAWRTHSWDRQLIPKPFARLHVVAGEPLAVPRRLSRADRQGWVDRIAGALRDADRKAWQVVVGERAPELTRELPREFLRVSRSDKR